MANILIADDHAVVRQGLKDMLSRQTDLHVGGEAADAGALFALLSDPDPWHLLILDVTMPGGNALSIVQQVARTAPQLPILIFTMHPEEQMAMRLLKAGASGYVTKDMPQEVLLSAIRTVLTGGRHISPQLAEYCARYLQQGDALPHNMLSEREFDVFCRLARGETLTGIAQHLNLSVKTISTYRARVLEKMAFSTNAELTQYAVHHDLMHNT